LTILIVEPRFDTREFQVAIKFVQALGFAHLDVHGLVRAVAIPEAGG
jgi:hypothetical protein